MRRHLTPVALLGALALLGACVGSDPVAPTPPRVGGPSLALGPALPACDPAGIRQTMATLYPTNVFKQVALPTFNLGEQYRQAGDFASARTQYFTLLDDLVDRYKNDILQTPALQQSTQAGVHYVVRTVLACAGDAEPENLATLLQKVAGAEVIPPGAMSDPRYQICVVLDVTDENPCVVPNERAVTLLPPHFLEYEALILMEPDLRATDPYAAPFGTTWSAHWRIRIAPIEAQANYAPPVLSPEPVAGVAFCVDNLSYSPTLPFHAPPGALRVAQISETTVSNQLLPRTANAALFALLDDHCDDATNQLAGVTNPLGDSYLARRTWQLARRAGSAVGELLAPASAYAFDGGAGGGARSFTSYFAAVEEPNLYIRQPDPEFGTRDTVSIPQQTSKLFHASRTRYGDVIYPAPLPTPTTICTWASSHNRVSVLATAADRGVTATLTTARSTGEAWIHATCADADENGAPVTRRDSMLVVVVR